MRLFFALWPSTAVRARLDALARALHAGGAGRRVPARNLHLTLAFLGEVPDARLADLERLASALPFEPFDLALAECGWFSRSRVAYVAPRDVPAQLSRLADALAAALAAAGFRGERRAFAPHVTLVRDARVAPDAPADLLPVTWAVRGYALVISAPGARGVRYRRHAIWPDISV